MTSQAESPSEAKEPLSQACVLELIPKWGRIISDVPPAVLDILKLKFVGFLEGKERRISDYELRRRAAKLNCDCGLSDGRYLLAEQEKIPLEIRGKNILLPGTVIERADHRRFMLYLRFNGACWCLDFCLFGYEFDGDDVLVHRG